MRGAKMFGLSTARKFSACTNALRWTSGTRIVKRLGHFQSPSVWPIPTEVRFRAAAADPQKGVTAAVLSINAIARPRPPSQHCTRRLAKTGRYWPISGHSWERLAPTTYCPTTAATSLGTSLRSSRRGFGKKNRPRVPVPANRGVVKQLWFGVNPECADPNLRG